MNWGIRSPIRLARGSNCAQYCLMKALIVGILAAMLTVPASGVQLSPGLPFPRVVLPSIEDGKAVDLGDHLGEKLMLHLFASW